MSGIKYWAPSGLDLRDITNLDDACDKYSGECSGVDCPNCAFHSEFNKYSAIQEREVEKIYQDVYKLERSASPEPLLNPDVGEEIETTVEHTGGSSSYYKVLVVNPTTLTEPYEAECNDIIEALEMNFAEGNAFKAVWRKAAARLGKQKKGNNALYDSEKIEFFGHRLVVQETKA
jgi:hypothetical protein